MIASLKAQHRHVRSRAQHAHVFLPCRTYKVTTNKSLATEPIAINFEPFDDVSQWLKSKPVKAWREQYQEVGYCVIPQLINPSNVPIYRQMYQDFLSNKIDATAHRHDLGSNQPRERHDIENICQIMWPTRYISNLHSGPLHSRALVVSQILLGADMAFDFDMLLYKAPHVTSATPWHQDIGYWPPMPDKRAASFWCAFDDVSVANGCMIFQPYGQRRAESEGKVFNMKPASEGSHVLQFNDEEWERELQEQCDGTGVACPIPSGFATVHHGYTPHCTGGNHTNVPRRVLTACYRPASMVTYERDLGFDHGYNGINNLLDA